MRFIPDEIDFGRDSFLTGFMLEGINFEGIFSEVLLAEGLLSDSPSFFSESLRIFHLHVLLREVFVFFFLQKFFLIQITSFKTLSLEVMHFPPKILKILSKNY